MELLKQYPFPFTSKEIEEKVDEAKKLAKELFDANYLKLAFSLIDLTTLNTTDTEEKGKQFAEKVNDLEKHFPNIPQVAAICVYPSLVSSVNKHLKAKNVGIASVAGGFPSSQTYIEVKVLECERAVANGAKDIDIVISLGTWLNGNYQTVFDEIKTIKKAIGRAHLKVILETGGLADYKDIWNASIVAMSAGADFIKTSTGKMEPAASPEAVWIMSQAIKYFEQKTNEKVGIKPAGGISKSEDALIYIAIVKTVLGEEWLNNKKFRLGASRLANKLIADIQKIENNIEKEINYF